MKRFKHNNLYLLQAQNTDFSVIAVYTDGEYIVCKHPLRRSKKFEFRLSVQREDKEPIRNWRVLQDIKNDVAGVDRTAAEIYPPETEVTDTGNMYHLWVYRLGREPRVRLTPPTINRPA